MPTRHLHENPDLDALRTQARRLQRGARAGDPEALRQVAGHDPASARPRRRAGGGRWATALHAAVSADAPDVVTLLLRRGADTTIRDERFAGTAADWAEHRGRPEIAMLLRDRPG